MEMKKNTMPSANANTVIMLMKCEISRAIGVSSASSAVASVAMRPITVWSPQCTTTPRAVPVQCQKCSHMYTNSSQNGTCGTEVNAGRYPQRRSSSRTRGSSTRAGSRASNRADASAAPTRPSTTSCPPAQTQAAHNVRT